VAAALDLPTSTAHRLLTSLRSRGYVVRARSGRYRLGPAAMALGRRASNGALAPSLRAALERVASETGETAVVGIRDPAGGGLLILDQLESSQRLRLALEIGYVQPLHAGAASRPARPPSRTRSSACSPSDPTVRPATITDRDMLLRDLRASAASARPQREEVIEGGWGVASPVLGVDGQARAVVGIIAPVAPFGRGRGGAVVAVPGRPAAG
jgi:DNA-binding IclR family transcriptional regulator